MGDWFSIIEDSHYRRCALLAEASRNRRAAAIPAGGIRAGLAALLIKVALWLAPAAVTAPRRAAVLDERAVPQIARI